MYAAGSMQVVARRVSGAIQIGGRWLTNGRVAAVIGMGQGSAWDRDGAGGERVGSLSWAHRVPLPASPLSPPASPWPAHQAHVGQASMVSRGTLHSAERNGWGVYHHRPGAQQPKAARAQINHLGEMIPKPILLQGLRDDGES